MERLPVPTPRVAFSLTEAVAWRAALAAQGKRLVFTSGCFDILHAGHVRYLQQARALGDALLVAMNSDASVRELKGPVRPIHDEADRAEVLLGLSAVDAVVVFSSVRTSGLLEALQPDIFAKGGDYTIATLNAEERGVLQSYGAEIQILPEVAGRSTTASLAKLNAPERAALRKPRLAILGSGVGSNFSAIAEAIAGGQLHAEIALVVSDVERAPLLVKARSRQVPALFIDPGPWSTKFDDAAQRELASQLQAAGIDFVVCAGFMRRLKAPVLIPYAGRILNIHPSLLPAYRGRDAIARALADGALATGCTVHLVDEAIDSGTVLAQAEVPILPGDTVESLAARVHEAEHLLYPQEISRFLTSLRLA
jgi:formyltetrahydrofolate-dependent phosphoribosylglycinamide formyltransferase